MRLIKNTTELIGIKDPHIIISLVFEKDTYIKVQATLDYPAPPCPHCQGKMIKYDFQKPSKIPLLEQAGTPTLLRLKKRRFQCKSCIILREDTRTNSYVRERFWTRVQNFL